MSYHNQNKPNDGFYWLAAIALMFFFPPGGLVLVLLKVLGGKDTRRNRPAASAHTGQTPVGARTTAGPSVQKPPEAKEARKTPAKGSVPQKQPQAAPTGMDTLMKKSKRLSVIGGGVLAVSLFILLASLGDLTDDLLYGGPAMFLSELMDLSLFICSAIAGGACLWSGKRKQRKLKLWRSYLAMIGRRSVISISALADTANQSPSTVRKELEDMLDEGVFPNGFLDYGGDRLILTGEGLQDSQPAPAPAPKTPHEQENAILDEIRQVNAQIKNETLSAQIDRIGVITANILDYQKQHPQKSPQLHSFLSYYLPTTLKILRAYGQLEAQQVSGQNIDAAMHRIEGMMDKVVEGFEKQLDQLFQVDAMDITADVEVLERMLAKDGLASSGGITLEL